MDFGNKKQTLSMSSKAKPPPSTSDQEKKARAEFVQLLQNLQKIEERLVVVETILRDAESSKPTAIESENDEQADNICFIVPHIASDFKSIEGKSLPIPQLIKVFYSWSESLFSSAMLNRSHMKNKHLRTHMQSSLEICQSLLAALRAHISPPDKNSSA